MQRRILKHITNYNILSIEHYGFRLWLRTDNATYKLTTEILNGMNDKPQVGEIFCDLEKPFDSVNHDILLYKLKFYGISDKDLQLYQSSLGNRYCGTVIYNTWEKETFISILNLKYFIHAANFQWPAQTLLLSCNFLSLSCGPLETWCGPTGCHWPTLRNTGKRLLYGRITNFNSKLRSL